MEFTLEEIMQATNAKILKNEGVKGLKFTFSTDTRTISQGQIYLPLKGENFNGEDFIEQALESGAGGFFVMENGKWKMENGETPNLLTSSTSQLILQVADTLTAYLELARFCRRKIAPKTVAVTGSSGKTTTKEMAYCVASQKFKTHKSELNYNNEVGLCKTILSMPEDTEVLIVEMGMRGLGEIELLSKYAEPDIAIIANVGTAHIGRLGSRENIAKAKCEVVKYLNIDGTLIAHEDEIIKMQRCVDAKMHSIFFSLNNTNIIERKIGYTKFEYKNYEYELNIEGDYNVQNSLAVIEMGLQLGIKPSEINKGLKIYLPLEKRWDVQKIKGFNIINDSYNANPESMKGVIKTVIDIYSGQILFVLGDMGELGENEIKYHQEVGEFLLQNYKNGVDVVTVGNLANEITKILNKNNIKSVNFHDNLQTSRYILDNVKIGTTIVLKASRSMKFEEIIEKMRSEE